MALNNSGPLSLAGSTAGQSIALELGLGTTSAISLNDTAVRNLAAIPTTNTTISLSNFYGRSSAPDPGAGTLDTSNFAAGLFIYARTGYHNNNVNYLPTGATFTQGNYTTINFTVTNNTLVSYLWVGYFLAPTTGVYQFALRSDDRAAFWIGSLALSGFTFNNEAVEANFNTGEVFSGGYTLTEGVAYPVRLLYGNSGGTGVIELRFVPPGGTITNNGTGYYFYRTTTGGF
jgi:hypothetical protein